MVPKFLDIFMEDFFDIFSEQQYFDHRFLYPEDIIQLN